MTNSFLTLLEELYAPFGNEWVQQNGCIFYHAKLANLSIAGSIAIALGRKKAIRKPGDIDFVCPSTESAIFFLNGLQGRLLNQSTYWNVQVNSRTSFCPDGCIAHFRIRTAFWLPICVMVIPEVNQYLVKGGHSVQKFDDVVKAAKLLDERDHKGRLDFEDDEPYEEPRDPMSGGALDLEPEFEQEFDVSVFQSEENPKYTK